MPEQIQIVDHHDQPLGGATRQEAWRDGLYHRIVHIILENEHDSILLQKRSSIKTLWPSVWTSSASGHVDAGESYQVSAARELLEELGVSVPLKFRGVLLRQQQIERKTINQFVGVFSGKVSAPFQPQLDPHEVSEIRWQTIQAISQEIAISPENFTPGFRKIIDHYYS